VTIRLLRRSENVAFMPMILLSPRMAADAPCVSFWA
jgi:hypothetical protein